MKKYRLAGEDEHTFHIQHPDGSIFPVAKNAVGPGVHKKIKALEPLKMADGGEVPDVTDDAATNDPSAPLDVGSAPEIDDQRAPASNQTPLDIQPAEQDQAPPPVSNIPNQSPQVPSVDSSGLPSLLPDQEKQLNIQEDATKNIAQSQAKSAQQTSQTWQNLAAQQSQVDAELKKTTAPLEAENQQLFNAVKNEQIDPNRLWNNMSGSNKVMAAISLILGGIGAGLTHQKNMALDVIDKSIDRDIESQRLDLGKKQTLFSENLRRLGDARSAAAATKMQLLTTAQAKVNSYMAQSNSAEAIQRGNIALADIQLKKDELLNTVGVRQLAAKGGNYDPSILVPRLVPKEQQKEVFHEIGQAQNARKAETELMSAFDQASKENTILKTGAGLVRTPASILKMRSMMLPIIHDAEGRVNEFEQKTTSDLEPKPGDTAAKIQAKRQALEAFLNQKKSAPTAKGFGINLDNFGSTSSQPVPQKVERFDPKSGKIAIFDSNSKQFLGFK